MAVRERGLRECPECGAALQLRPTLCPLCGSNVSAQRAPSGPAEVEDYQARIRTLREQLQALREGAEAV